MLLRTSSESNLRPIRRFTAKTVASGLVTACRLAICPTRRSPASVKPTIDGVVRLPSELGIPTGSPPSMTATQLLVVPRSMPMTLGISGRSPRSIYLEGETLPDQEIGTTADSVGARITRGCRRRAIPMAAGLARRRCEVWPQPPPRDEPGGRSACTHAPSPTPPYRELRGLLLHERLVHARI